MSGPNALATVISATAAVVTVWQTSKTREADAFVQLRAVLNELYFVETRAAEADEYSPCGPYGCMGSLALKESQYEQYRHLAMSAFELAEDLNELESETLAIADALYKCGHLDESVAYAETLAVSSDYDTRFSAHLLLAQNAYFENESDRGDRQIDLAIAVVKDPENEVPKVQQGVLMAQAHLTRGRMKLAMGDPDASLESQSNAFSELRGLPETNRVRQLILSLQSLVVAMTEKNRLEGTNFKAFRDKLLEPTPADEMPETNPVEAPPQLGPG